jgi:hypothetical protein
LKSYLKEYDDIISAVNINSDVGVLFHKFPEASPSTLLLRVSGRVFIIIKSAAFLDKFNKYLDPIVALQLLVLGCVNG